MLVHCREGVSRSSTIALAYLVMKKRLGLHEAVAAYRSKRELCPNSGFIQQLIELDENLNKGI